jgi:transposase
MPLSNQSVSTREFAQKAGVSMSTVAKWLRSGKIEGEKKNGKWWVSPDQLAKVSQSSRKTSDTTPEAQPDASTPRKKKPHQGFTIEEFSAMTFLTEFGVRKFLREGRLVGAVDGAGNPGVDAANLEDPLIKRLMR